MYDSDASHSREEEEDNNTEGIINFSLECSNDDHEVKSSSKRPRSPSPVMGKHHNKHLNHDSRKYGKQPRSPSPVMDQHRNNFNLNNHEEEDEEDEDDYQPLPPMNSSSSSSSSSSETSLWEKIFLHKFLSTSIYQHLYLALLVNSIIFSYRLGLL
jgi:hypothetical protein